MDRKFCSQATWSGKSALILSLLLLVNPSDPRPKAYNPSHPIPQPLQPLPNPLPHPPTHIPHNSPHKTPITARKPLPPSRLQSPPRLPQISLHLTNQPTNTTTHGLALFSALFRAQCQDALQQLSETLRQWSRRRGLRGGRGAQGGERAGG